MLLASNLASDRSHARGLRALLLVVCSAVLAATPGSAQRSYTAREAMVPMRDGVKLYTQIFAPEDATEPLPFLLLRTPYGVDSIDSVRDPGSIGPSRGFAEAGYIFVRQDVRGQFRSEGEWDLMLPLEQDHTDPASVDESTDCHDTVAWLLANVEGHNGRAGMWGISYDGWETVMAMTDAHPALVAVSPQASPADEYVGDDVHHNGAFRLAYTFSWLAYMAVQRGDGDRNLIGPVLGQDGYEFFLGAGSLTEIGERYMGPSVPEWSDLMEHGDYDEYWQRRNALEHLGDVRPAVLNVAGWFDAEDFRGPIDIYHEVEKGDDADRNFLVVGPWMHGGWNAGLRTSGESLGDLSFGEPTAEWFQEVVELPFFEHHLRGGDDPYLPEVFAFETGANLWHDLDQWPPAGVEPRPLYLRAGGGASFEAPDPDEGATSFESDPARPVPYSEQDGVFPGQEYMVEDQRFLAGREDVLIFETEPLDEDLVIAGRTLVHLFASTTGSDADWVVKLIDVYPEDTEDVSAKTGASMAGSWTIVSGDILRAKYRESLEHPSALEPGKVTELTFELPDRLHRFRAGHRIMVQAHSTWFPMYDRNPQVFMDIYHSSADDFVKATHALVHEAGAASQLVLPVFER